MLQNLSFICFGSAQRLEIPGVLRLSSLRYHWFLLGFSMIFYGIFWGMHSGVWKILDLLLLLHWLCGLTEMIWFMASWGRQVYYWLTGVDPTWESISLQTIPFWNNQLSWKLILLSFHHSRSMWMLLYSCLKWLLVLVL